VTTASIQDVRRCRCKRLVKWLPLGAVGRFAPFELGKVPIEQAPDEAWALHHIRTKQGRSMFVADRVERLAKHQREHLTTVLVRHDCPARRSQAAPRGAAGHRDRPRRAPRPVGL
jgi:hypothetical protein